MSLFIILVAWWVCNSLIQSRGVMFVNDRAIRCHTYFEVWDTTVTWRRTRVWGLSHKASLQRPLYFKYAPAIVLCARARLSNWQAVFTTLLLDNLISKRTLVFPLFCFTFTDSRWETDKWPVFVKLLHSHDVSVTHKRQFLVKYTCP
jgi:hypothetical protein